MGSTKVSKGKPMKVSGKIALQYMAQLLFLRGEDATCEEQHWSKKTSPFKVEAVQPCKPAEYLPQTHSAHTH